MLDRKTRHVFKFFADLATDAESKAKQEPLGYSKEKLTVPAGEKEAIFNLWAAPDGQADLHVWLAHPGDYDVDGKDRPNFFEVTSIMRGHCIVEEKGHPPVERRRRRKQTQMCGATHHHHIDDAKRKVRSLCLGHVGNTGA